MAVYNNSNAASPLASVELTPVSDGNFSFFHVKSPEAKEEIKQWLASPAMGQEIVAESVVDGRTVLVTHGDKSKDDILKELEARGEKLELKQPDRKFNSWKWRGALSMIGQPMQFISGWNRKGKKDNSVIVFALLNMSANIVNWVFGAQRSPDEHRMRAIKTEINGDLEDHVTLDQMLHPDDKRVELRKEPEQPKGVGEKFHNFMQRNSVTLGEIGLRYFGGISLVAPMGRWPEGFRILAKEKSFKALLNHIKNPDAKTRIAGTGWLVGKTLAFFAKTPDPYNPEPKSAIDNFREKWLFKVSTLSEMAGSSYLAHDRLTNQKRKIMLGGKEYQDYIGGIGGLLFSTAFAIRLFAPYGVKELNMEEVYAHATDTLAKTPPEKLPQLMADTAGTLKEHLKDKDISFSEIFTQMMTDMYRYHHIALDNLGTEPEERAAKLNGHAKADDMMPEQVVQHAPAEGPRHPRDRVAMPAASHAGSLKTDEPQLSLGA